MKRHSLRHPIRAEKSLGQNFLTDVNILKKMDIAASEGIDRATVPRKAGGPLVLEIGPGTGSLTEYLCKWARLIVVEKDPRAVQFLVTASDGRKDLSLCILQKDILHTTPKDILSQAHEPEQTLHCVGNLPYNISSEFLLWFAEHRRAFLSGHFLLQKEVVDRITAQVGTKNYGRLTVLMSLLFEIEPLFPVPPDAFVPRPKVHSAFFRMFPSNFKFASEEEKSRLERVSAILFSQRRKMLRRSLPLLFQSFGLAYSGEDSAVWNLLAKHGISPTDRAERLSPHGFLELTRATMMM